MIKIDALWSVGIVDRRWSVFLFFFSVFATMDKLSFQRSVNNDLRFSYIDYAIFIILLILSSLIGVYYGFLSKTKQNTADEYLLGSKKMSLFPIAVSLIVS